MKIKIKRRKRTQEKRNHSRSIPLVRYYKTTATNASSERKVTAQRNATSSRNLKSRILSITKDLSQTATLFVIIALLLSATVISSVGIKLQDQSEANPYRPISEYQQGVQAIFEESLQNRSKFTLDSDDFESRIIEAFPEVAQANAIVPLAGRKVQVGLKLSSPLVRLQINSSKQGVVSEFGKMTKVSESNAILASFSDSPLLTIQPSVSFKPGDQAITSSEASLLRLLLKEFDGSQTPRYEIASVTYFVERRELQISFKDKPFKAKLTPERAPRPQVGSLIATLEDLAEKGEQPTNYIDVRVEGRVFIQ